MAKATPAKPKFSSSEPIMPRVHAPLRTLGIAMTVMCYLACLALGGLLLINRAVSNWTSDIQGEVTVQIREIDGVDLKVETQKALDLLKQTPGVVAADTVSRDTARDLLEPWLGRTKALDDLPIPAMISVTINQSTPPDFVQLEAALTNAVQGASVDTHRRWQAELTRMASTLQWLAFAILAVIAGSAVALVIYATRTALEANRDVIEVLYLVGARDKFIASQVERRFLKTGLRAGLLGVAGGILTYALVALTDVIGSPSSLAQAARGLLFGSIDQSYQSYLVFLGLPAVATLLSLVTARYAVMRILRSVF